MSEQISAETAAGQAETAGEQAATQQEPMLPQSEVNRIVQERVQRERAKFADYDVLKAKAGEQATAEERIAALEKQNGELARERLVARIQARHGISDEDASLFLTGADEDALNTQAARLAEHAENRKKQGNVARREGATHNAGDKDGELRDITRALFKRAN